MNRPYPPEKTPFFAGAENSRGGAKTGSIAALGEVTENETIGGNEIGRLGIRREHAGATRRLRWHEKSFKVAS